MRREASSVICLHPFAMPSLKYEKQFLKQGCALVAGVDEAGRGAWAGPVVAAAVILPLHRPDLLKALKGVNDSKQLTPRQRERLFDVILSVALAAGVGGSGPGEIDREGIVPATRAAMQRAHPFVADFFDRRQGMNPGRPQCLGRVDVTDAGDARLLHEQRLDLGAGPAAEARIGATSWDPIPAGTKARTVVSKRSGFEPRVRRPVPSGRTMRRLA